MRLPSSPLPSGTPFRASAFPEGSLGVPRLEALGQRPILDEGTGAGPAPAAQTRAQTVFEATGFILILLMVIAAAWILVRRRL